MLATLENELYSAIRQIKQIRSKWAWYNDVLVDAENLVNIACKEGNESPEILPLIDKLRETVRDMRSLYPEGSKIVPPVEPILTVNDRVILQALESTVKEMMDALKVGGCLLVLKGWDKPDVIQCDGVAHEGSPCFMCAKRAILERAETKIKLQDYNREGEMWI